MRREVDPQLVGGLSFVVPGAGLAYMGQWGWGVAAFVTVVGLIRLISVSFGHPVIVWLVLASLCSAASIAFAKHHNERLMEELLERVEAQPPPPPPPESSAQASRAPSPPPPPPPESSAQASRGPSPPPPSPREPSPPSAPVASPPPPGAVNAATVARFCPSCGTRNEGNRFCPQCGSSLQVAPT